MSHHHLHFVRDSKEDRGVTKLYDGKKRTLRYALDGVLAWETVGRLTRSRAFYLKG